MMQEKLEQILSDATDWMTAAEIADNGGWRSAANVGLALKQMGSVECRTSPTKLGVNGKPVKEFRLVDKRVDQPDKTPTPSTHTKALRERIEQLEQDVSKQRALLDAKRDEIEAINDDIRRHVQRADAAERDLASINLALELDPNDDGAAPIIEAFAEIRAALREESAEADRLRAENLALKALNESMPGFGAEFEKQKAKKPAQPRRPFSVTGLAGYHAGGDKVTLFLDRRLNARSVTLPADKLAQLAEMAGAQ